MWCQKWSWSAKKKVRKISSENINEFRWSRKIFFLIASNGFCFDVSPRKIFRIAFQKRVQIVCFRQKRGNRLNFLNMKILTIRTSLACKKKLAVGIRDGRWTSGGVQRWTYIQIITKWILGKWKNWPRRAIGYRPVDQYTGGGGGGKMPENWRYHPTDSNSVSEKSRVAVQIRHRYRHVINVNFVDYKTLWCL